MEELKTLSFEVGPYRPPSEAFSLLIRVTRNCSWNRCHFCHLYKPNKFEYRPVADIKRDIDTARLIRDEITEMARHWGLGSNGITEAAGRVLSQPPNEAYYNVAGWLYAGGTTAFLQDSNTLIMRTGELVEVIKYLKETFPGINRVTSYGRSDTADKKTPQELNELHRAGLSRLHIGLETGYDPLLKFIDKGVTAAKQISGGRKVVDAGISLCEYVILGLGGKEMWREHATETARVLNEINPDFIRVRTLTLTESMPLYAAAESGTFTRATDEEIIEEEKRLLENLNCTANFVSDHITNLLGEVEGKFPRDKGKMLAVIDRYQALSPEERLNFRVGRRAGIYTCLDDLSQSGKHETVAQIIGRISDGTGQIDENVFYAMMTRFI